MILPTRARFLRQRHPEPLVLSIPSPTNDPYELYQRLSVPGQPSFLLESGKGNHTAARYSFMGGGPYLMLSGKEQTYEMRTRGHTTLHRGSPWNALRERLRAGRIPNPEGLPPFFGGAVVFFSYDLARQFEHLPR